MKLSHAARLDAGELELQLNRRTSGCRFGPSCTPWWLEEMSGSQDMYLHLDILL